MIYRTTMKVFIRTSICCILLFIAALSHAQIKLPQIICDSMILQRDTKIKIWGWASKGEKVSVQFDGKTYRTTTGNDRQMDPAVGANESRRTLHDEDITARIRSR